MGGKIKALIEKMDNTEESPRRWLSDDKRFFYKHLDEDIRSLKPQLDQLAERGLAPSIEFETRGKLVIVGIEMGDDIVGKMPVIEGVELYSLHETDPETLHSVQFAKSLAALALGLHEVGLFHNDFSGYNVMYQASTGRCVVVDLDSITPRGTHQYGDYIQEYCESLVSAYLGRYFVFILGNLEENKELQRYMPNHWREFAELREHYPKDDELLFAYASEPVGELLEERGITSRVNPRIINFALRGLDRENAPTSFDEILNIPDEIT